MRNAFWSFGSDSFCALPTGTLLCEIRWGYLQRCDPISESLFLFPFSLVWVIDSAGFPLRSFSASLQTLVRYFFLVKRSGHGHQRLAGGIAPQMTQMMDSA